MYNRNVPIYGFITVDDTVSILSGHSYIFMEVDIDPLYLGEIKIKANSSDCCILRLDPSQFTVGVIA